MKIPKTVRFWGFDQESMKFFHQSQYISRAGFDAAAAFTAAEGVLKFNVVVVIQSERTGGALIHTGCAAETGHRKIDHNRHEGIHSFAQVF